MSVDPIEGPITHPGIVPDLQKRIVELEEVIKKYAAHDSWRCSYYQKCHCDLDATTDSLGLPRIPYPPQ